MAEFSVLCVCTGNICRSPVAAQWLRASLAGVDGLTIDSAGTGALVGTQMPQQAQALSLRYSGNPSTHQPRQLVEPHVAEAQLVLAMTRDHRKRAVELWPRASRYTFTAREFARLSAGLDEPDFVAIGELPLDATFDRLSAMVELVTSRRGTVDISGEPVDDDVVDPYRRDDSVYELAGQQLAPAMAEVARAFRLALRAAPAA